MRLKRNLFIIDAYTILINALFIVPVAIPFYINQIGIGFHDFLIGEALFAVTLVILEVPSGWISDVWKRKHILSLGNLFCLFGFLVMLIANSFGLAMLAQILIGIGISLISGTDTAILYDSLLSSKRTKEYQKREGRRGAFSFYTVAVSSVIGGFLYSINPYIPLILTSIFTFLAIITTEMLDEPERHKKLTEHSPLKDMLFTVRYALHGHSAIAFLIFFSSALFASTKIIMWIQQPYYIEMNIPEMWFGVLVAAGFLLGGISSHLSHLITNIIKTPSKALSIFLILALVVCIGAGIKTGWVGVVLLAFGGTCIYGAARPIVRDAINNRIDSSRRATILSTQSLMVSVFFIPLSAAIGFASDNFGLQGVFISLTIWLLIAAASLGILLLINNKKSTSKKIN